MKTIRIGLIGSGFVAELHMYAYKRVYGVVAEVVGGIRAEVRNASPDFAAAQATHASFMSAPPQGKTVTKQSAFMTR